jgi:lipopolysaccharide biosynthesis glycosyltransferase
VSRLDLACATNEAYCPHAATLMHSAAAAAGDGIDLHVHLLHGGLPQPTLTALRGFADQSEFTLELHEVHDSRLDQLAVTSRFPAEIWFRLLLPEVLPDLPRALYLDVDTVVLDDLAPLWTTELAGAHIGAVTNIPYRPEGVEELRRYPDGLDLEPRSYFNSGVVLIDLDSWRRDGVTSALLETATASRDLAWPDQSVLNLVLGGSRAHLEPRWNATTALLDLGLGADLFGAAELRAGQTMPAIRHFEGIETYKPWHYLCRCSYREVYLEHRSKTPWGSFTLDGRTPANVWLRVRGRAKGVLAGAGRLRP